MAETILPVFGGMFDSTEVTETVGGFPRGNKAVDSDFFAKMISCFWSDGVFGDDSFKVTKSSGMIVSVSPGIAWAKGYMSWQKNQLRYELRAGTEYTVALRLNVSAGQFYIVFSRDTTFVPNNSDTLRDLVLAVVTVPAGASAVTEEMIKDMRHDKSLCGIVTSTVDALGAVELAQDANNLGGVSADSYLKKEGGVMTGDLVALPDTTGKAAVRNIGYGTSLPESLGAGELFILIPEE